MRIAAGLYWAVIFMVMFGFFIGARFKSLKPERLDPIEKKIQMMVSLGILAVILIATLFYIEIVRSG